MIDPYYLKIYETKVGNFEICRSQTLGAGAVCVCVCVCVCVYVTASTALIYNSLYSVINRPEYNSEFLAELTAMAVSLFCSCSTGHVNEFTVLKWKTFFDLITDVLDFDVR